MGFFDWIWDTTDVITKGVSRGRSKRGSSRELFEGILGSGLGRGGNWRTTPGSVSNLDSSRMPRFDREKSLRKSPRITTTEDILAQLEALQDPSRYLMDPESLSRQAMSAASAQYDPLIAALEQQMGSARSRGERDKAELGQMFSALSSNLQGDIPAIQKMFTEDKAESKQGFDELQAGIKSGYAQSAAEQEEMLKRLNIEAAAPDILPEQQRDRDFFTQLAARDAQVEQSALGQEERASVDYTRQGSQIARSEGTQRQANLMSELSDLLAQYEGQIGSHRAAKQSAYQAGLGELQSQMMSEALDRSQRDFDNYIRSIQLGKDLRSDEAGSPAKSVRSPADVGSRAMSLGLNPAGAQDIQDVFMSAIGRDPQILAGVNPTTGGALPKEALALRILEAGKQSGLSREELNALQTIALEYFGRG